MTPHRGSIVQTCLDSLQAGVRQRVSTEAPELEGLLDDYFGEATFGAAIIEPDLGTLPTGANILEVGAGALLLSCALQQAGFHVTALEPAARGFSHLDGLRRIVVSVAAESRSVPEQLLIPGEELSIESRFDFAFSINVMEHVADVAVVLGRVLTAVRPGRGYRFVCPNYLFPYEPHFDIPTLFSKSITGRVFRRRILSSPNVVDPASTWASLNWISVPSVRRICRTLGVEPHFDRELFHRYVERALSDPSFRRRRSACVSALLKGADRFGAVALSRKLPAVFQPVISCWIVRGDRFRSPNGRKRDD